MKTNWMKRLGAAVLSLAMAAGMSACGSESVEQIIAKTQENVANINSVSYVLNMDMDMSVQGQSFQMVIDGTAETINDPYTMHMNMGIDMGELGKMETVMYMQVEDDKCLSYTGMDMGTGELTWTYDEEEITAMEEYNAQAEFDLYMKSVPSFTENGTETINGTEATRYDGIIAKDALEEVIDSTGVLEQFSGLGMDTDKMVAALTDLDDLPVSIWINVKDHMPVKYEMDMTAIMQSMMSKLAESTDSGDLGLTIDKVFISLTLTGINNVAPIEIPAEALAAA